MKQINVRLLIFLLLIGIVGTGSIGLLYRFQLNRGAESLLRRSEEKLAAGDKDEAAEYLRRYVSRRNKDGERWKQYALLQKERLLQQLLKRRPEGRFVSEVFRAVETAVRLNPNDAEVREAAADLTQGFGQFADAIQHLEKLVSLDDKSGGAKWKIRLAGVFEQSGEREKALPILGELVGWDPNTRSFGQQEAIAPHEVNAYATLGQLLMARNLPEAADAVIEKMIEVNPDQALAYVRHGDYLLRRGREKHKDLERDATKALELEKENIEVLLFAGQIALITKDFVRSKALYERCRELFPDRSEPIFGLVEWARRQQKFDKAIVYLNEGIEAKPTMWQLPMDRALLELQLNRRNDFDKSVLLVERLNAPPMYQDLLRGLQLVLREEWLDAAQILSEVRGQFEASRTDQLPLIDMYLLASYEKLGQTDRKLEVIERMLARTPTNLNLKIAQIQALLEMRQEEKALSEFEFVERAIETNPELGKPLLFTRLKLELLKQGRLPDDLRDWRQAQEFVAELEKSDQANIPIVVNAIANYYEMRGMAEKATVARDRMSSQMDDGMGSRLAKIAERIETAPLSETLAELDTLEKKDGISIRTRLVRAFAIIRGKPDNLQQMLEDVETAPSSFNSAQQQSLWEQLGRYYLMNGLPGDARRLWEKVLEQDKDNVPLRLTLFQMALESGEAERIEAGLKEFESNFGRNSPEWNWGNAARLVMGVRSGKGQAKDLDEAMNLASAGLSKRANWNMLHYLRGEVFLLKNRPDDAIAAFEKARQLGLASYPLFQYLLRLYYDQLRFDDAEEVLSQIPQELWTQFEKRVNLHLLAMQKKLPDDIKLDGLGDDQEGYVWTGRLLADAGRLEDSLKAFQKATELAPDSPVAWSGMITVMAAQGDKEKALQILDQAKEKVDLKSKDSFLATSYRLLGDVANAEVYYQKTLQDNPNHKHLLRDVSLFYIETGATQKAIPLLHRMLEGAKPHDPETPEPVRWARRMIARATEAEGKYSDYTKAIELLKENALVDAPLDKDDLLLWAQFASKRAEPSTHEQVVEELKRAQMSRPLSRDELLQMALLYESLGDWTSCQSILTELLIQRSDDLLVLDPFLQLLIKHDEWQAAAKWMKNCPPDSLAYIRTQAEVDVRRGRSEDVITMFSQLVKSPGEEDIKKQRLRFVAQLAEQLGAQDPKMFAVADSAFRQFVAKDPNANVEYLDFQIRRFDATKTRDMLTICSKMMDANQHSAALSRAVTLLRAGGDRIPQREKVVQLIRSWFDKAIKANPDDLMLTIHRAELEGNLGDTDTQANMLREFVEKNKTQTILRAIALNNLSYIESLRGNGDQAKVLIDEAIAIFGPQTQLRDTVGMALLAQGKAAEAIEEFQYVIDHGDSSALILFHLFWALWENGQVDQAVDAMTKAKLKGLSDRDFTTGLEIEKFQELKIAMAKQGYNFENLGSTADRQESDRAR